MNRYFLHRNNEQTGPFIFDQLIHLPLVATDLIWIEGKSATWKKAADIQELKFFIKESNFLNNAAGRRAPIAAVERIGPYRVSKNVYVSLPVTVPDDASKAIDVGPQVGKTKKEFLNRGQKIETGNEKASIEKASETKAPVNAKYIRPLADIKDEYISWLRKQRSLTVFRIETKKLIAGIFVLIALGSTYAYVNNNANRRVLELSEKSPSISKETRQETLPNQPNVKIVSEPTADSLSSKPEIETISGSLTKNKEEIKHPQHPTVLQSNDREEAISVSAQKIPTVETKEQEIDKSEKNDVPVYKLVEVKGKHVQGDDGLSDVHVTLKNKSEKVLKLAAVDVVYFRENNKVASKEIVYFSNVQPGETLTLNAPAKRKAISAEYQLGLISTAEGAIHYAKQ